MTSYHEKKHILLRDVAHRERLTPGEYPAYERELIAKGVAVAIVGAVMPGWRAAWPEPLWYTYDVT